MPQFRMIVHSRPLPGLEAEYNDWYQNVHLKDIVAIPGFVAAQRWRLAEAVSGQAPEPYMAVYEIEAESAQQAKQALLDAASAGRTPVAPVMDMDFTRAAIYAVSGERVDAEN